MSLISFLEEREVYECKRSSHRKCLLVGGKCFDTFSGPQTGLPARKMGINDAIAKYLPIGHAGNRFTDLEHQSNLAKMISALPGGQGLEVTDMYAMTSETASSTAFCVWPSEAPYEHDGANEVELVARLRAGDEGAFREIVERYASKISRVSYGILRNLDDADEIAQEVFAKVYCSIHGFGGRGSLYSWIYRIAVNECYGLLRKKRFKMVYWSDSSDDTPDLSMEAIADSRPTPDRTAMQRDFINKLLARIPEEDRWLLISKEVEGFSLAELSEMSGLSENTIKVRLFRVRQRLVDAVARLRPRRRSIAGGAAESVGKISPLVPLHQK